MNTNPATITSGTRFSGVAQALTGTNTVTVVAQDQSSPVLSSTNRYAVTVANGASTTTSLNYDLNGNLLGDGTRTFEWDSRNRLTAVNKGTHRTEFSYDGLNRRVGVVEKENGAVQSAKRLVWAGLAIAEERDGVTNTLTKCYSGSEMTLVSGTNAGTYFYTRDHLGSVREVTDGSGVLRARYDYDPYGRRSANLVTANAVEADFGYTGHYMNVASGLTLAPYRAYDPELGRWISRDPLGDPSMRLMPGVVGLEQNARGNLASGLPVEMLLGPNLYEYVRNDPTNGIDPDGRAPMFNLQELLDFYNRLRNQGINPLDPSTYPPPPPEKCPQGKLQPQPPPMTQQQMKDALDKQFEQNEAGAKQVKNMWHDPLSKWTSQ